MNSNNIATIVDLTNTASADIDAIRFAPSSMTATTPMVCRFNTAVGWSRESANVAATGYMMTAGGERYLWLRFKDRDGQPSADMYVYVGATVGLFYGLLAAESAGKYVNQNVRSLPYVKLRVEVGDEFKQLSAMIAESAQ